MPGAGRRRPTTATRLAWLRQAYLARHGRRISADTLRRTVLQVRRDTPDMTVLDRNAPARTLSEVTPET